MALAIVGIEPTVPISPTPLAPSGLVKHGASVKVEDWNSGKSSARGIA